MKKDIETINKRHLQEFEKKRKQKRNVNKNVFDDVDRLMIHLIDDLIVHYNIVLYQNQQSSLFENLLKFIKF